MCGRYTLSITDLLELEDVFGLDALDPDFDRASFRPRYNAAPSDRLPVVTGGERRVLRSMEWGFTAGPKDAPRPRVINARVETLAQRPLFRQAFRERRVIVPATGYFEWQREPGSRVKTPMWIHPAEGSLLAFAGLYRPLADPPQPSGSSAAGAFVIVTVDAVGALAQIHPRAPLVLNRAALDRWLSTERLTGPELRALVESSLEARAALAAHAVDRRVSSPGFDRPECIVPVAPGPPPKASQSPHRQLGLFER